MAAGEAVADAQLRLTRHEVGPGQNRLHHLRRDVRPDEDDHRRRREREAPAHGTDDDDRAAQEGDGGQVNRLEQVVGVPDVGRGQVGPAVEGGVVDSLTELGAHEEDVEQTDQNPAREREREQPPGQPMRAAPTLSA